MASNDDPVSAVSRRDFFKTVGATSIATGVLTAAEAEAQAGGPVFGPGDVPVRLTINGRVHNLTIEPRVTLLDAVRVHAALTGNKRVCDRGTCGACTMIVDGRTLYSCSTLAIEMQGKQIRTVEGLARGNTLHPVQQAFCEADAMMCGFCTPGFVVATVALLEKFPRPTEAQAKRELDGNVCRCGTFNRILEAAMKVGRGGRATSLESAPDALAAVMEGEVARG
jgi:xanthine dehydrogenase YagT iron-sulfur-binding subunit